LDILKGDLGAMFSDLYEDTLDVKRLNYGVITLVPKLKEANNIKHFRPILSFECGL
jgi:hypothetical protein